MMVVENVQPVVELCDRMRFERAGSLSDCADGFFPLLHPLCCSLLLSAALSCCCLARVSACGACGRGARTVSLRSLSAFCPDERQLRSRSVSALSSFRSFGLSLHLVLSCDKMSSLLAGPRILTMVSGLGFLWDAYPSRYPGCDRPSR